MVAGDDVLDDIISQIGGIGKQQKIVLTCLFVIMLLHSITHIAYVFTSMDSDYRCLIPECDGNTPDDSDWLKYTVPFTSSAVRPEKCLMYKYMNTSTKTLNGTCNFSSFNKSAITSCSSYYFYDNDYYLGREFDLLCDENLWILSLVGTMNTVGMFIGLIVTGFISDRYGRKRVLIFGMSGCGVIGLIKTLSPSIVWYLVFELTEAIFSAGTCGCVFIIAIEAVLPNKRALMGCILNTSYALGEVLLALIAWSCQYWRSLIYYIYSPCVMIVLLYWILPESLRWTLSKGRIEESKQTLRNIAKVNKKQISENTLKRLENVAEYSHNCNSHKFIEILKSKSLCWRFVNCCFGWMTCAFLFYGITLSSVSIYGNKYLDFILISMIEFPAYFSTYYIIDKLGRRASICGSYLITFVSSICFIFSTNSTTWFYLLTYCMGKFGATAAFNAIYILTSEIFPTPLRHTVMGLCSTLGRLGSLTSPQVSLLGRLWEPLPMIMFGSMSLAAGIVSYFLPESKGIKLPETVEEAERIK